MLTVTSFGVALRQAREALGLSTQDVALRTKIRGDYLRALEDGDLKALPERTFARSYLTRYARELNLDPQPLLQDFDRAMPAPVGSLQVTPPRPRGRRSVAPLLGLAVGVALLIGGGLLVRQRAAAPQEAVSTTAPVAEVPVATKTVRLTVKVTPPGARVYLDNRDLGLAPILAFPVDAREQAELRVEMRGRAPLRQAVDVSRSRDLRVTLAATGGQSVLADAARPVTSGSSQVKSNAGPAAPVPAVKAASPAGTAVQVTYSGPSWTRVTDARGRILFEGTPAAGTVKTFDRGVTIRTGNAAAVRVSVGGAPSSALGQAGEVVTRTF